MKRILDVFNDSFSDYIIPFKLTEETLKEKMQADKTDLSLSVGVFENKRLVAFILHGFDVVNNQKLVYNGGTGVIPRKRGSGLTTQMYLYILPILLEKRIDKLVLEVITNNIQAIKSYKRSGFKVKRQLLCYKGEVKEFMTNNNLEIKELTRYNWKRMKSFWDIYPTWQNSINVIDKLGFRNKSLGAYIDEQLVGYVIFNPMNKRILQIAVSRDFRNKGIASTLIFKLKEAYGKTISVINVDKRSNLKYFFNEIGLKVVLEQLEMELRLDKSKN